MVIIPDPKDETELKSIILDEDTLDNPVPTLSRHGTAVPITPRQLSLSYFFPKNSAIPTTTLSRKISFRLYTVPTLKKSQQMGAGRMIVSGNYTLFNNYTFILVRPLASPGNVEHAFNHLRSISGFAHRVVRPLSGDHPPVGRSTPTFSGCASPDTRSLKRVGRPASQYTRQHNLCRLIVQADTHAGGCSSNAGGASQKAAKQRSDASHCRP
ncbi:hypothetical protein H2201_007705 [Coniosporium apollinis]|uniref:Uncharacterized protein n=1 Tax=Coniosporium apollinis TaxID=61459 RepID=A0ABQ9NKQ7_9PEZI|nr:hypothetical protein H2201_007705 [Coniosporium apollinis]